MSTGSVWTVSGCVWIVTATGGGVWVFCVSAGGALFVTVLVLLVVEVLEPVLFASVVWLIPPPFWVSRLSHAPAGSEQRADAEHGSDVESDGHESRIA
jgi:hypothetical protein